MLKLFVATLIVFVLVLPANADPLSINEKGMLLIKGSPKWNSMSFEINGFKLAKDKQVYISEGELSHSIDDYDINIVKKETLILFFEIRDKKIYRSVLLDPSVPIRVQKNQLRVGDMMKKAVSLLGSYSMEHGEDIGSFFIFNKYQNISFYTECDQFSWELNRQRVGGLSDKIKEEGLRKCQITKILFWGDKQRIWH